MKNKVGFWRKKLPITSGFTQAGGDARRQFCGDLEVYRPPEHLCNPRLREAAITLYAILGQSVIQTENFRRT